jgi:hypothetical protein
MIFGLQYALVVAGYAAPAFLLGNYMIMYTGASQLELGLIFTIQPAVIFVRPIVCSLADRYQSHRAIYLYCSLLSFLTHLPFIILPFIVEAAERETRAAQLTTTHSSNSSSLSAVSGSSSTEFPTTTAAGTSLALQLSAIFTERVRFWVLVVSHFAGCVFFCCMRTLGDVLTVNHCRRIRTSYTKYRRLGPISFGMCSLVLGYINCNETLMGLPDYVPGFILYSTCHMTLCILFYLWPEEFFEIVSEDQVRSAAAMAAATAMPIEGAANGGAALELDQHHDPQAPPARLASSPTTGEQLAPLPSSAEVRQHIKRKIGRLICCCWQPRAADKQQQQAPPAQHNNKQQHPTPTPTHRISTMQQVRIVLFLVQQDFRIPLYMLVLVGCGIMGHSVQNFVYVYLAVVCREQNCSSSAISGYIMLGICVTETIAYSLSSRYFQFEATRKHKLIKVEIALAMLTAHYLVLGLLVHQSAYYFLAEALHGFEFGLMIATSIELGDYFANEVSLIIPQLIERRIVSQSDDLALVRVSLIATMLACFLLVYDGLGGIVGGLLFGFVVDRFGFPAAFKLNALLSAVFLMALLFSSLVTQCTNIRPKVAAAKQQQQQQQGHQANKTSAVVVENGKGALGCAYATIEAKSRVL